MANGKRNKGKLVKVTKTIEVMEAQPDTITLELTLDEAQFIADVFAKIGGAPTTRRKHQESISGALYAAGIYFTWHGEVRPAGHAAFDLDGGINVTAKAP
jgi:hypothetical protein